MNDSGLSDEQMVTEIRLQYTVAEILLDSSIDLEDKKNRLNNILGPDNPNMKAREVLYFLNSLVINSLSKLHGITAVELLDNLRLQLLTVPLESTGNDTETENLTQDLQTELDKGYIVFLVDSFDTTFCSPEAVARRDSSIDGTHNVFIPFEQRTVFNQLLAALDAHIDAIDPALSREQRITNMRANPDYPSETNTRFDVANFMIFAVIFTKLVGLYQKSPLEVIRIYSDNFWEFELPS